MYILDAAVSFSHYVVPTKTVLKAGEHKSATKMISPDIV